MPDLTPERLAELRALARAALPRPDGWLPDSERRRRFAATVSPDVVVELLDEIERLRTIAAAGARALYPLEVRRQVIAQCMASGDPDQIAGWDDAIDHMGQELRRVQHSLVAAVAPGRGRPSEPYATTTVSSGDLAIELPAPPDRVVDLMEALERSVADAKAAQSQRTQRETSGSLPSDREAFVPWALMPSPPGDRYRVRAPGGDLEGTAHPSMERCMGTARPHPGDVWVEWDDDTRGWYDADTLERIP